jgi:acyl-coenzyme A thioesterase PaaI-like protein
VGRHVDLLGRSLGVAEDADPAVAVREYLSEGRTKTARRLVLTVEYKVNFLAPAWGEKLVARGEVLSTGRRLFVCRAEVEAVDGAELRTCATLLQTVSLSPVI